jgi:serine/threonine protein kinase
MIGQTIGPYHIVDKLGEGGMGEVYRARDTKLDREVALKILPESFASDPDRLMRFEREAKTLASLNHPHIAQIHGFEQTAAISALVMELVEGEDLSQRIARGAIPLDEALPIAKQIAEALEAAPFSRRQGAGVASDRGRIQQVPVSMVSRRTVVAVYDHECRQRLGLVGRSCEYE